MQVHQISSDKAQICMRNPSDIMAEEFLVIICGLGDCLKQQARPAFPELSGVFEAIFDI